MGWAITSICRCAEDLGAEPLFVINVGMSHTDHVPMNEMGPWVQDAHWMPSNMPTGQSQATWGAKRAKNGHPKPFQLEDDGNRQRKRWPAL